MSFATHMTVGVQCMSVFSSLCCSPRDDWHTDVHIRNTCFHANYVDKEGSPSESVPPKLIMFHFRQFAWVGAAGSRPGRITVVARVQGNIVGLAGYSFIRSLRLGLLHWEGPSTPLSWRCFPVLSYTQLA